MSLKRKAKMKAKNAPAVADAASATVVEAPPPPAPNPVPMLAQSKITFTMYCVSKGIKERHRAGMATWAKSAKVVKATFDEWENIFKGY